jgi:GNAT superfamily N-acetyltransferase
VADIRRVTPEIVRPLRSAILRPGQPFANNIYPGDDDSETVHFAAYVDERPVGSTTVLHQAPPLHGDAGMWRLRGVTTLPDVRGQGCGVALITAALDYIAEQGGALCWFFANPPAVPFYEKLGFRLDTALRYSEAAVPPAHPLMWRRVEDDGKTA